MAQPTIIGAGTNGYAPTANSGSNRVFTLAIPAEAKTMVVTVGMDSNEGGVTVDSFTLTGVTGAVEIMEIDMSPSGDPYRASRAVFYDLSDAGAATGTLTASLSTSSTVSSMAGVVCTDGFLESFVVTQERQFDDGLITAHSGNMANNTMVYMQVSEKNLSSLSYAGTGVATLYNAQSSDNEMSVTAASQATTVSDQKAIAYSGGPSGGPDGNDMTILFSSQPNPFADINPTGDIISHDIITN
jgi:hypothetical protein